MPDPTVILDGGTITAVGTALPVPAGATVVDLGTATLLPGLVDTHVHLAFDASADPVGGLAARDEASALTAMTAAARHAARGGVTTVRDLGDRGYLSLAVRDATADDSTLPTVVAAGPPITSSDGHCYYLGGCATAGVDGIRAAVREHADRGVDVVKIMASGGNLTPGSRPEVSQFSAGNPQPQGETRRRRLAGERLDRPRHPDRQPEQDAADGAEPLKPREIHAWTVFSRPPPWQCRPARPRRRSSCVSAFVIPCGCGPQDCRNRTGS
jgi:hypothetical protein